MEYNIALEGLAQMGLPLPEMTKIMGVASKQVVSNTLKSSGLHGVWLEKRQEEKIRRQQESIQCEANKLGISQWLTYIDLAGKRQAGKEELEVQRAWEYTLKKKGTPYKFEDLVTVFRKHRQGAETGVAYSLEELREGTSIPYYSSVARILAAVRLKPMSDKAGRKQATPENKREAIKRSLKVEMPYEDIAYFIGVSTWVLEDHVRKSGKADLRPRVNGEIWRWGNGKSEGGVKSVTYRLASQIFEGRHRCRYSPKEISEVLGVDDKVVDYVIRHEKRIREEIITALRILYGDKTINRPYKKNKF